MNAIVPAASSGNSMVPSNMDQAMKLADMMARGKMLPQHLQGSPGDCLMVVEQAMRWQMSPFAVAQCTSSIKGKLMFEGKLVAAAVEASGAIVGSLDYTFDGEGPQRRVTVSGVRRGETDRKTVEVTLKDAITENGIWKKQPDQQLCYHGARVWARRWTPGVMLGVYSPEEMTVEPAYSGVTIEAAAEPQTRETINQETAPRKPSVTEWLDRLTVDLDNATTSHEVDGIIAREDVQKALDALRNGARDRLNAMVKAALDRTAAEEGAAHEPEGVE